MKKLVVMFGVLALLGFFASTCRPQGMSSKDAAGTSEEELPDRRVPYFGDLLTRSTLSGDWLGYRNELAAKGLTFDLSLTQIGQGVLSGGRDTEWEYGGRGDITIELDTQKAGWWPGGFFTFEAEGNFGDSVNFQAGGLMPVNANQVFPRPGVNEFDIPEVSFTQFLSHYIGLTAGKLDTMSGDANRFAHGKGDKEFFNLAFNINPVALLTTPYSTLGTGVIFLPTGDPKQFVLSSLVLSSTGTANTSGFDTIDEGVTIANEGRVRTNFFNLTGHQLLGFLYSTKTYTDLSQDLRILIDSRIVPQDGSWALYYNFDQYLYEVDQTTGEGIGVFGRFGVSDGNPNPIHHFFSLGVGGKGVIPHRPLDRYGIGWYYIDVSNPELQGILPPEVDPFDRSLLRDEQGFEMFYNFAITPYMLLTPDIQVIRPGFKRSLTQTDDGPFPVGIKELDTATVFGIRLKTIF